MENKDENVRMKTIFFSCIVIYIVFFSLFYLYQVTYYYKIGCEIGLKYKDDPDLAFDVLNNYVEINHLWGTIHFESLWMGLVDNLFPH